MTALIRYQLADLVSSQRWVAPLLCYVAFLGFFYETDAGPAVPAFGVSALVLLPIAAWLTRQLFSVEDEAARQVSAAAAGGPVRVQLALLLSAVLATSTLVAVAVLWAVLANHQHVRTAPVVLGGIAVHLVFALAGLGLGAVVARPLVRAPGAAALGIVAIFVLGLIVHWSPIFQADRTLQTDPVHHFLPDLLPWLAALVALSLACAVVSLVAASRE